MMKNVNTVALTVIAVAALVCGTILAVNGVDASALFLAVGTAVGAIAGVTVPRNPAPAIVEPVVDAVVDPTIPQGVAGPL